MNSIGTQVKTWWVPRDDYHFVSDPYQLGLDPKEVEEAKDDQKGKSLSERRSPAALPAMRCD